MKVCVFGEWCVDVEAAFLFDNRLDVGPINRFDNTDMPVHATASDNEMVAFFRVHMSPIGCCYVSLLYTL